MSLSPNLEEITSIAKQIQDNVLEEILKLNANTGYLQRFLHGSSDKELFKKNVPVVSYEDIKPYIERVANGEPFDVISGKPITGFILSTGTSGGKQKMFPVNNKYFEDMGFCAFLSFLHIHKNVDGVQQGKIMNFMLTRAQSITPCGLPVAPATTMVVMNSSFKNRPFKLDTSPDEVILCTDSKQSMYCHLLCGLVQRDEVVLLSAAFASVLVQAIKYLENYWKELCNNIRLGYLSEWISDLSCRNSVSTILGDPNPELADLIEQECNQESWEGIITRIWTKSKVIHATSTGQMAQYIPLLEFYSNKLLPIVSSMYVSSETFFGININPLSKPKDVSYTFLPNISYFEFLSFDGEVVDLVNVKLGCFYEPLVTNYYGLHRCKVGDILQVTGFYNNTPQFRFVRRNNVVLSVGVEATTEEDLLKGLRCAATRVLESSNLMLTSFTSYVDISTLPGHYVLYWELKTKKVNDILKLEEKVMVECCCVVEESLDVFYRNDRRNEVETIGALEIRVVEEGTFDCLMEFYISRGASMAQYKTPLCINSSEALEILENKVLGRFFSDKLPPAET